MTLLSICLACAGLSLNGQWEFRLIASNGVDACEAATIEVPSCWEMKGFCSPCYDECVSGERGLYRRRFSLPKGRGDGWEPGSSGGNHMSAWPELGGDKVPRKTRFSRGLDGDVAPP